MLSNRQWRVTLYRTGTHPLVWIGYAPNKRFARWNARDELGHMAFWKADKITIGMCRKQRGAT